MKKLTIILSLFFIIFSASANELKMIKGMIMKKDQTLRLVKKNGQVFIFVQGSGKEVKKHVGQVLILKGVSIRPDKKKWSKKAILSYKKLIMGTAEDIEEFKKHRARQKEKREAKKKVKEEKAPVEEKQEEKTPVEEKQEEKAPVEEEQKENKAEPEEDLEDELDLLY